MSQRTQAHSRLKNMKKKDFVSTKEDCNVINVSQNFDEDTICSYEMEPNLSKRMHFKLSSATLHFTYIGSWL